MVPQGNPKDSLGRANPSLSDGLAQGRGKRSANPTPDLMFCDFHQKVDVFKQTGILNGIFTKIWISADPAKSAFLHLAPQ